MIVGFLRDIDCEMLNVRLGCTGQSDRRRDQSFFRGEGTTAVLKETPATSPEQQEVVYEQVIAVATSWSHPNVLRLLRTSPYATRIIGIGYREQRHGVKLDLALKQVQYALRASHRTGPAAHLHKLLVK